MLLSQESFTAYSMASLLTGGARSWCRQEASARCVLPAYYFRSDLLCALSSTKLDPGPDLTFSQVVQTKDDGE